MENINQLKRDLTYNYIYEIQNIEANNESKIKFFTEDIILHALICSVYEVGYKEFSLIKDLTFENLYEDCERYVSDLPNSLQSPIVLNAAIVLIEHFVNSLNGQSRLSRSIISSTKDPLGELEVNLEGYKSCYDEIIKDLKQNPSENGLS